MAARRTYRYRIADYTLKIVIEGGLPGGIESFLARFEALSTGSKFDYLANITVYYGSLDGDVSFNYKQMASSLRSDGLRFEDISGTQKRGLGWRCLIDIESYDVYILTTHEAEFRAYTGTLGHLLLYAIPKTEGSFFHCAGLRLRNRILLFLAPGGTGKTTLARHAVSKDIEVLSDEAVFVSWYGDQFIAHGTPLGYFSNGPLRGLVDGIFFIRHGDSTAISSMGASQALVRAWNDSFYRDHVMDKGPEVFYYRSHLATPEERRLVVQKWWDFFSSTPCFDMALPLDFDDWDALIDAVEQA